MEIKNSKVYLSYNDTKKAHEYAVGIINTLKNRGIKVHLVGIARGSFSILHELAVRCNLPYTILQYQSYDGNDTEIKLGFSSTNFPQDDELVFIVDDIADSGNTINKTLEYLQENVGDKLRTYVFTIVGSNKFNWDYYYNHEALDNAWIVFPYEV